MTAWPINSDMVPSNHAALVAQYRATASTGWNSPTIDVLGVALWDTYGADVAEELLTNSNHAAAMAELDAYGVAEIFSERGMTCVRLYNGADETSGYTPAAIVGLSILSRLEEYPILDESDYVEREWEQWSEDTLDTWADSGIEDSAWQSRFHERVLDTIYCYYSVGDAPDEAWNDAIMDTAPDSAPFKAYVAIKAKPYYAGKWHDMRVAFKTALTTSKK